MSRVSINLAKKFIGGGVPCGAVEGVCGGDIDDAEDAPESVSESESSL